jgi:hypothetical protein
MTEDARAASWIMASILIREDRARRRTSKDAPIDERAVAIELFYNDPYSPIGTLH